MSKADKILEKMSTNPRDWQIDSLKTVARSRAIEWRRHGGSHVVFIREDGRTLPVPVHRPIKPVYIRLFLQFVED